jgi:hypothetical protein
MLIQIPYLPSRKARMALLNRLDNWSMPIVVGLCALFIVVGGPPGSIATTAFAIYLSLSLLLGPAAQLEAKLLLALAAWWWILIRLSLAEEQASAVNLSVALGSFLSREKILQKLGIININLSPQLLSDPL